MMVVLLIERTIVPDASCVEEIYSLLNFIWIAILLEAGLRVSLFITCYNDTLFPETGKAVVRVLERLGHAVEFPPDQTCCGQMHWNTGYLREAVPIIRHFVEVFRDAEVVCIPSSSCVAMIRDHYHNAAVASGDR